MPVTTLPFTAGFGHETKWGDVRFNALALLLASKETPWT
jgi:hypothetical protein